MDGLQWKKPIQMDDFSGVCTPILGNLRICVPRDFIDPMEHL